ncbi:MAG: 4Fe-4S binding protein [Clostridia bacterium]|nr:4Fe-4S binding protein [Clostridia bacterium]
MAKIEVNKEKCKACELCLAACPLWLLRMSKEFNSFGDHYCEQPDSTKCTGCTLCAIMCPDMVITVYK